jgi:hypothetical protein
MIDAFADGAAHSGDDKSLKLGFEIATSLAEEAPSNSRPHSRRHQRPHQRRH